MALTGRICSRLIQTRFYNNLNRLPVRSLFFMYLNFPLVKELQLLKSWSKN